jgi:IS30 family transposase
MTIQIRIKDGFIPYKIAKELGRHINTVLNEIRRGTPTPLNHRKYIEMYLADAGEAVYQKHRLNSCRTFKRLECNEFINHVVDKIKNILVPLMLVLEDLSLKVNFRVAKLFALKHFITILILVC